MNARLVASEFTLGAFWVYAEWIPPVGKISKSEKASQWILVSSWGSKEAAAAACQDFMRMT